MLNHLSEESKQAAATTLVSSPPAPALSQSSTAVLGHRALAVTVNGPVTPQPTSEEDLCPICYAHPISAIFRPCSHKSCK